MAASSERPPFGRAWAAVAAAAAAAAKGAARGHGEGARVAIDAR